MEKRKKMRPALERMRKAGRDLAEAEYHYKVALRKEVLLERAKETAVGVIDKTVYGHEEVGMLRLKRDIAQSDYEVFKEVVLYLKFEIRIIDAQLSREWSSDDN